MSELSGPWAPSVLLRCTTGAVAKAQARLVHQDCGRTLNFPSLVPVQPLGAT